MIVNPSHGKRRVKRARRGNPSRVRRMSGPTVIRRRRKKVSANPGKKRGTSMKYRRVRRNAGKKKTTKKRTTKKRAATRKKTTKKRSKASYQRAAKKAARTRKLNAAAAKRTRNKKRPTKATAKSKRLAKKRTAKKRTSKKRTSKKRTAKKRTSKKRAATKKTSARRSHRKKKATKRRRRPTNHQWAWSNRKTRKTKGRGRKKRRVTSSNRVARTYMAVKRVQAGVQRGTIKGGAAKRAKAMGLLRVNPPASVLKDFTQTATALAIPAVATVGGMYALAWGGLKISGKIAGSSIGQKLPEPLAKNIVPLTTAGLSLGSAMALRRLVKKKIPLIKMDGAQLAPWIAVGGLGATFLMFMAATDWGKKITSKLGLSIDISTAGMAQAAAEGSQAAAAGLGSYVTVSQYLGAYGVDISPMGPSWYGRRDMRGLGEYVDASPQNEFSGYIASDFPVHSPGPGDNQYTMATLGAYDEMELEQTPGGTMINPMGEADGIFGGRSII